LEAFLSDNGLNIPFEIKIQKLLVELEEPHLVADQLLKIWNRGELKFVEQTAVCHFLSNAGFYSTLVSQLKIISHKE